MTWIKGSSGNPGGRPRKAISMTGELRRILELKDEAGTPLRHAIAHRLALVALDGNVEALRYVFDRIDGKPIEQDCTPIDSGGTIITINEMTLDATDQPRKPAAAE